MCLTVESSDPRTTSHVNLFKFSIRQFKKHIPSSEGSKQVFHRVNDKVAMFGLLWDSVGKSSSKASQLCNWCLIK